MIADVLAYLAAAVALAAVGIRLWAGRGCARPGEAWTLCFGGALVALSAIVFAPSTALLLNHLDTLTGVDLSTVTGDSLRVLAAGGAGLLATMLRADGAPSPRAWMRAALVTEVLLVASFAAGDFHVSADGRSVQAHAVSGIAYDLIRLLYPVLSLGLFVIAIWPYARELPSGTVRTGARMLVVAALVGILWSGWTIDDIQEMARHGRQNDGDDLPSVILEVAFVVSAAAGMTVTFWGRFVGRVHAWLRAAQSYRAMAPLWQELCGPRATVARSPVRTRRATTGLAERLSVSPWRASIARYRRVIEIRDAQLALRPYLPPGDSLHCSDAGRGPAVEARQILAGLAAFGAGRQVVGQSAAAEPMADAASMQHDIETEAEWLARVSSELALALATDRR